VARKETLEKFLKHLNKLDDYAQQSVKSAWNKDTLLTMAKAQFKAPVDKATLQRSARSVTAKITRNGIESAFIFGVPYALKLEENKDELTIYTDINPNAQDHYVSDAIDENEKLFVDDVKKAISVAWGKV